MTKIRCFLSGHDPQPIVVGFEKLRYRCSRCGAPRKGLIIPSIEGARLGPSIRKIPRERRQAAVDDLLRRAQ